MKQKIELSHVQNLEFRVEDGETPTITGYAAVFNSRSENLGGFVEIIKQGAFARSISEGADVRALVDHDSSRIIGRTKSGTLKISEDARGLKIEVVPPNTTVGRDVVESIKRGDLDGMSFGFRVKKDDWKAVDGGMLRELHDVDLVDISVVSFPAYLATSVTARSVEEILAQGEESLNKLAAGRTLETFDREVELRGKEFEISIDNLPIFP